MRGGRRVRLQRDGTREFWQVLELFCILIVMVGIWIYTCVHRTIHRTAHPQKSPFYCMLILKLNLKWMWQKIYWFGLNLVFTQLCRSRSLSNKVSADTKNQVSLPFPLRARVATMPFTTGWENMGEKKGRIQREKKRRCPRKLVLPQAQWACKSAGGLIKMQVLIGRSWAGLWVCISKELPGDAAAIGPGPQGEESGAGQEDFALSKEIQQ